MLGSSLEQSTLAIDGMFCDHCPDNINNALSPYVQAMVVDDPVALDHLFVKFTYSPELPKGSIRHIIRKVQDLSSQFTLSIAHPMTLEDQSAKLQKRAGLSLLPIGSFCRCFHAFSRAIGDLSSSQPKRLDSVNSGVRSYRLFWWVV